ncbi:MAG TPA: ABC transporter ATP-binding protein [Stellaceae bacterium]|nr:ABC transporter ATP-binding protein [Stellaceae bacterium]
MATVALDGITKRYGDVVAVDNVSLDVAEGEFVALLGPSGCGKTTTLRMISGFADVSAGSIRIDGRDVTAEPPYRRNIGVVFQNYALFPHLTVFENVAFGLRRRRIPAADIASRVARALDLVKLGEFAARMPRQLSGGQQQRVAIARALVIEPDLLLLDEPLSNLDAKLRHAVRQEMRRLQQMLGITTIMVTHDQDEAMAMGDRLVVMNGGRIQQIGTPQQLYRNPANLFVASFIGQANVLTGTPQADGAGFVLPSGLAIACTRSVAGAARLMIRPEALELVPSGTAGRNICSGTVSLVTYLGPFCEVTVDLIGGETLMVQIASDHPTAWAAGQSVGVRIDPAAGAGLPPE